MVPPFHGHPLLHIIYLLINCIKEKHHGYLILPVDKPILPPSHHCHIQLYQNIILGECISHYLGWIDIFDIDGDLIPNNLPYSLLNYQVYIYFSFKNEATPSL